VRRFCLTLEAAGSRRSTQNASGDQLEDHLAHESEKSISSTSIDTIIPHSPLDSAQLKRINSVHRGFLFQHLVSLGCLLLAGENELKSLRPERDEDVELEFSGKTVYIQVKFRSALLQPNEISGALMRFAQLREEHSCGARSGKPEFVVFTNAELSPLLSEQVTGWPPDTFIISASLSTVVGHKLPPVWCTLEDAVSWCISKCTELPFGSLNPETLVWKLAGMIQAACTGEQITFSVNELPSLLELLVAQVQRFPVVPTPYWLQEHEPEFNQEGGNRLVVGISGSGKTAWAANGSLHCGLPVAYFDVLDIPSTAVASMLVRELAAAFYAGEHDDIRSLLLPGPSGLQSLTALDRLLERDQIRPIVVFDNVHRISSRDLVSIATAAPSIRFFFLAQPWPAQAEIETRLSTRAEVLSGLSAETVGRVFAQHGCPTDFSTSDRLLKITGGLPLFVSAAAMLCTRFYQADAKRMADALESGTVPQQTGQEIIIGELLDRITPDAQTTAALLSFCTVPIDGETVFLTMETALQSRRGVVSTILKELANWGVMHVSESGELEMHDAFRLSAASYLYRVPEELKTTFLRTLADKLKPTKKKPVSMMQFRFYCSLLPKTGDLQTLADLASSDSEFFAEQGMADDLKTGLLLASEDASIPASDRFWALDTLAFWAIQDNQWSDASRYVEKISVCSEEFEPNEAQAQALLLKKLLIAGFKRDLKSASSFFIEASRQSHSALFSRITQYNYANVLYHCGKYRDAEKLCEQLTIGYYDELGLELGDVVARNLPHMAEKLGDLTGKAADLKRLGDVLRLRAMCLEELGKDPVLCRMHAHKFYVLADAVVSVIRVGQEVVDELIGKGFFQDAKGFIEGSLIPWVNHKKLLDYKVPVTSQYAVVLAYCGEFEKAACAMNELRSFAIASPRWRAEFENQENLIAQIASARSPSRLHPSMRSAPLKVGRNEPCPCGSGKKWKRCCGA